MAGPVIALFGGTGGTGIHLIHKLAKMNPPPSVIRCLVREGSIGKLPPDYSWVAPAPCAAGDGVQFERVFGQATDANAVRECVAGADVVVVTLGGPPSGPGVDICSISQTEINKVCLALAKEPLVVVVSSIGVGDHYQHCSLPAKFFSKFVIPVALEDKAKQEDMVRSELKDWIVVRPGGLVDKPASGGWRAAHDLCSFMTTIGREDVATFIVDECVAPARQSKWLQQSVAVMW